MSGPIVYTYDAGVASFSGVLFNLGGITAGHIEGTLTDPCGPDTLAHLFAGEIN